MNVSEFVNALADNPESNIVHDEEYTCAHIWAAEVEETVLSHYSQGSEDDEWMDLDNSETLKVVKIRSVHCENCGEDAPPEVVARVKEQLR